MASNLGPDVLTRIFDETSEDGSARTPIGMAHWAGSGPEGLTCKECLHFEEKFKGRCLKVHALTGQRGKPFPAASAACKYFEASEGNA